ncbi:MAG: excinuclease ABC subunit UvrC [Bacteroidales bacterium]|jgi:excinuclease ABC subunit C|nr:excinuclease ABC subunit UvrC [Bacteroidales bacterium]
MPAEVKKHIKQLLAALPDNPGVYQFFDKVGTLLYVGKAKNLKKRVNQYFSKEHDSARTTVLVRKIETIKHLVVESEEDALLLENNLIKKNRPRYNILLKDDKTFPWIVIKNEGFPRIFFTRNYIKDGSQYFGPYANIKLARFLLDMLHTMYQLRTCKLNLEPAAIAKGKFQSCLQYHLKNCLAPCEGKQSEDDYMRNIQDIKNILRGNISEVIALLKIRMQAHVELLQFEQAGVIKKQLEQLESYKSRSTIVSQTISNVDVFSILMDMDVAYVNFLKVQNGAVIQMHTMEIKKQLEETPEELLAMAMIEIRQKIPSTAHEIIVPIIPDFTFSNTHYVVPQKGDKKALLDLSERNAKQFQLEKLKNLKNVDPERHSKRILETMKADLHLRELPVHIECFDNSNIGGSFPVAACVVFKNAKPSKADYRHFNIRTVEGPNDFASMEEILTRRYSRLLAEHAPLPQLVIVDGGKGQLSSAVKIFKQLGIFEKVQLIGIAKRLEEIFFPNDPVPLYLSKTSETLKVIQNLRNEAHRFGITHHRNQRSKFFISSELTSIEGIGEKTAELLLKKFKTIGGIQSASIEELATVIGQKKAEVVKHYFTIET